MPEPVAVLSADIHLAQRAWTKHPGLTGDSYYGLTQLVDYCCQNELDLVLAGDIFDKTRPDPETAHVMRTQLDRMERQNLSVFFNQGNHERDMNCPWMNAISWWPEHIHRKEFSLGPIKAYGLDWTPADQIREELNNIPPTANMFVAHQVWKEFLGDCAGDGECSFADVPHVKLIFTGDFHRNIILRQPSNRLILSPGSVCMQSIDEESYKDFFVLRDDLSVIGQPLKSRRCFRLIIDTKEKLEEFLSNVEPFLARQIYVPAAISKNIIHITYQEDIPEAYSRITNAVGQDAHLFLIAKRNKQEIITIEKKRRRDLAEGGMTSCLELMVEKDTKLYNDTLTLLHAVTPQDQLKTMKSLFLMKCGVTSDRR